jgi:hypothetical protein
MHPVDVAAQVFWVAANAGSVCVSYVGNDSALRGFDGLRPSFLPRNRLARQRDSLRPVGQLVSSLPVMVFSRCFRRW